MPGIATREPLPLSELGAVLSYPTAGQDAKIDWKALSKRIGNADVAFSLGIGPIMADNVGDQAT